MYLKIKKKKLIFLKTKVDFYFRQEVSPNAKLGNSHIYRYRPIIPENFVSLHQTISENTRGQNIKPEVYISGPEVNFSKNGVL